MIIDLLSSSYLKNILNPIVSGGIQLPWVDPAKLPAPDAKVSQMLDAVAGASRGIAGDVAATPPAFSVKDIPPQTQANPGEALRDVAKPPDPAVTVDTALAAPASNTAPPSAPTPDVAQTAPEKPPAKKEPSSDLPQELRDKGWTDDNWKDFKQLLVMSSQDMLAKAYDRTMQALRG
jgi:hypothetical protein